MTTNHTANALESPAASSAAHAIARRAIRPGEKLHYLGESPLRVALTANIALGLVMLALTALVWKFTGLQPRLSSGHGASPAAAGTPAGLVLAMTIFFLLFVSIPFCAAIGYIQRARRKITRAVMLTDRRLLVFDVDDEPTAKRTVEDVPLCAVRSSAARRVADGRETWTVNAHWPDSESSQTTGRVFHVRAGAQDAAMRLETLLATRAGA